MDRLLLAIVAMTVGCGGANGAPRSSPPTDAQAILALTRRGFDALRTHDADAFDAMLTADFVARSPGAKDVTRADFLKGVRALPAGISAVDGEALDVRVYGDTAALTGVQRATVRVDARDVVDAVAFTDIFVRRAGTWKLALSYSVPVNAP